MFQSIVVGCRHCSGMANKLFFLENDLNGNHNKHAKTGDHCLHKS